MKSQFFICVDRCNLKCDFCWYERGVSEYSPATVTLDELRHWFSACSRITELKTFSISGGEPLLVSNLVEMIDLAKEHFLAVVLMTNGTRLTRELARSLAARDVEVHVSLDSIVSDHHQRHRGAHRLTLRACETLESVGLSRRGLVTTVCRHNIGDIEPLQDYATAHGFSIEFHPLATRPDDPAHLMHCTATERAQLFKGLQRWSSGTTDRLAYVGLVASLVKDGEPRPLAGCHFTQESIVIGADGSVSPCFVKQAVQFGNIRVDSPDVVQERRLRFLRTANPGSCLRSDCLGVL